MHWYDCYVFVCVSEIQVLTHVANVYLNRQTYSVVFSIALGEKSVNVIWHHYNDFIISDLPAVANNCYIYNVKTKAMQVVLSLFNKLEDMIVLLTLEYNWKCSAFR
jgi:hypothetical protein